MTQETSGLRLYKWTVTGESYHEHSSQQWQEESHEAVIAAEFAGEALEAIVTGRGTEVTLENTIPWDLISQDREIIITIRPLENP